jgi:hypothetical protein
MSSNSPDISTFLRSGNRLSASSVLNLLGAPIQFGQRFNVQALINLPSRDT